MPNGDGGAPGALIELVWMALSAAKASLEATVRFAFLSLHVAVEVAMPMFNIKISM